MDDATDLLREHFPSVLSDCIPADPQPPKSAGHDYVAATSIDPSHLTLNLRILAFIEACRTIPLEYSPPKSRGVTIPPALEGLVPKALDGEDPEAIERQLALLSKAQKLYALVSMLPKPSDRAVYAKELKNVGGLLAYKVPETSSMSKYLSQERREAVAEQINSAILCKQ